ncbi:MAG: extracellular solute-binding protein [Anaerolineae bacterium]|nr:extracellular solute-binding protein [Anaerolineae bacterium]
MTTKKIFDKVIGIIAVLMLVASCTPAATEQPMEEKPPAAEVSPTKVPPAATESEAPVAAEEQDFTTWFEYDQNNEDPAADGRVGNKYLRDTIPQFNEAFEGKWNWVNQPKAWDKMEAELVAAVQAGGDVPDLYQMLSDSVNTFYRNGTVQNLREWAEKQSWYADLDSSALAACKGPDGGLYCIPLAQRPNTVFVWKDRFPDGFPKTPEEFMKKAEELKAEGLYAMTFFASTDKGGNGATRGVFTTFASFGGGYDDGKGNMLLNTPENVKAVEFLREIVAKGYVPEIAFAGGFQEEEAFKDASAGSFPTGLNGYLYMFPFTAPNGTKYEKNSSQDFLDAVAAGDIYISSFLSTEGNKPGCDTKAVGVAIPVGAKHPEAAHDYINWIMTPEQNADFVLGPGAGFPALKSTLKGEQFQTAFWQEAAKAIGNSACRPWYGTMERPTEAKAIIMAVVHKLIKESPNADIAAELTKAQEEYNAGN